MRSRRRFLELGLLSAAGLVVPRGLSAGQRGLEQFTTPAPPCKDDQPTPAVVASSELRPSAPARTSLLDDAAAETLTLAGYVIGLKCGRIKGARLDFWHADARGAYDAAGHRWRGHQLTDTDGRYRLETIVPGASAGRAPHLNVRVQPPGKPALTTALFFPDDPANARDRLFNPLLTMKRAAGATGRALTYDFILDL